LLAVRARGMRAIPKGGCYSEVMTSRHQELDDNLRGEEAIVALLAPLTEGDPGAFGLQDDCALLAPESGTELVLKTDPIAEGVHFLPGTAPEDIAWKALAVNVSDLAAKGATPVGYLMALSFPNAPSRRWFTAFAAGLKEAQSRFGCRLLGGDTDRRPGPLTVSITAIGSVPKGRMVRRATARPGDTLFVSGTIGDAALGLALFGQKRYAEASTALERSLALYPGQQQAIYLLARIAQAQGNVDRARVLAERLSSAEDKSRALEEEMVYRASETELSELSRLVPPLLELAQAQVEEDAK